MTQHTPAIAVDNLVRRYGRTDAVDGLTMHVPAGRCYGLFGRNGAGKTTTIKCLLNLLRPTSGQARVFGLDPYRDEVEVKSRVAYVPERLRSRLPADTAMPLRLRLLFLLTICFISLPLASGMSAQGQSLKVLLTIISSGRRIKKWRAMLEDKSPD